MIEWKQMIIRRMTIEDYEQVYRLWLGTPGMGLNSVDDSREGIACYLRRNPATCFVAEKDGVVTGVILSGHDGRRGFIHHMAVAEKDQRQGIGEQLLAKAMEALGKEHIHKVALVVFENNLKGNAFWEKQGFVARADLVYRNKAISETTRIDT